MVKKYKARKEVEVTHTIIITTCVEDPNWVPPFQPEESEKYREKREKY